MRFRIRKDAVNLLIFFMSKTLVEHDELRSCDVICNDHHGTIKINLWIQDNYKEILSKTLSETYELLMQEKETLKYDQEFARTCFHLVSSIFSIIPFRSLFITRFANDTIDILHQISLSHMDKYFEVRRICGSVEFFPTFS
jgi:hypothetical protein